MSYNDDWPTKREGARLAGWLASGGVVMVVIIAIITVAVGGFVYLWAPWKGEIEARNNTIGNGQYVVASYDYYFDQCGAIQATEKRLENYQTQLNATPPPTDDAVVRLQGAITAESNTWFNLVTEYNANADKEKYKGQFKDDNLPDHIDPVLTIGVLTTCA